MFCRPIALSMPPAVSTKRGGGCPVEGQKRDALDHHGPERTNVGHPRVLDTVPEGPGRGDHGVAQHEPRADVYL